MARILVVEDDQIIQRIMQLRLEIEGHDVIQAADGIEGVALAQSENPDLIFMDMLLPRLNGWLATEQIKAHTNAPIIALTGASTAKEKQMMLDAGCVDYVIKPIDFSQLFTKLNTLLK
jgi:DNA-binding response OmpR family regulator